MKVKFFGVFAALVLSTTTLATGQINQLPPDPEATIDEIIGEIDETIITNDPLNGTIPTINSLQTSSLLATLTEKMDTYADLVETGLMPSVPLSQVDMDDIGFTEGILPNQTFSQGLDLLGDLLGEILENPTACISVSPAGGTTSTTFTFDASCSADVQTATRDLQIRWDWNGDGTYDTSWTSSLSATHSYSATGTMTPTVQVRDADGNTATTTTSVQVSGPPSACFTISPSSGTTATSFRFDASCSSDDFTDTATLRVRWDWTNNGGYDTSWTTAKTASHTYNSAGTKTVKLQVQDGSGLTSTMTKSVSVTYYNGGGGGPGCPDAGSQTTGSTTQSMSGGTSTPPPEVCTGATQSASASTMDCDRLWEEVPQLVDSCDVSTPDLLGSTAVTPGGELVDQLEDDAELVSNAAQDELNRTPVTDPVLFQRLPGMPYEPAQDGEAWLAAGDSLRLRPAAPPASAIIDQEWLQNTFGTYGSPTPYTIIFHEGRPYARITDPNSLQGLQYAFEAIVLGQSNRYTNGHPDIVELSERGMQISFTSYPGSVTSTATREAPNGTIEENRTTFYEARLGIDFAAENTMGQPVRLSAQWLNELGLTQPRFIHEDGNLVPHTLDGTHYTLLPEHFSTIFIENFDSGAADGWALTGLWHVTTSCVNSYNGGYHLAYNQDGTCTYDTGSTTSGTATFDVNLAGVTSPLLIFRHRWTIESYASAYDIMRVQISTNGGSSWTTLQQWDSTDGDPNSSTYHQGTWTQQSYSLSAYTGGAAKIRFSFNSGDSAYNGFLGWLIDNVQVTGTTSNNPPNACFSINPSSGTTDTTFQVNAGCSSDTETSTSALQVRWDWENDGVYDTSWTTTKTASHLYATTGTKTLKLQVKDGAGLTDTYTKSVPVSQGTVQDGLGEDFESGTPGWSLSGLWSRRNCRPYAGDYSLAYNQGSCSQPPNYDVGTTSGNAASPTFKVPEQLPVLRFTSWYQTEGGTTWDQKLVQISTNGGSSWTTLEQIGGNMEEWSSHSIALDEYAGSNAKIRFRFDSGDGVYNAFQGWYVDDVAVVADEGTVVHTSNWVHSKVNGQAVESYRHHDGSGDVGWAFVGDDDSILQRFVFSQQPEIGGQAYLWVAGKSFSCSGAAELTHEFLVNGQVLGRFAACGTWSDTEYQWAAFSFSTSLLSQGTNTFQVRGFCSCSEGVYLVTDDDSGDTYTDLTVNGVVRSGHEAFWYLSLYNDEEFETSERYLTIERRQEDGTTTYEHVQEAYVFLDQDERHILYLMQREPDGGGPKTYMVSTLQFEKRAEYNSGTKKPGWHHYEANPENMFTGGSALQAPSNGGFYTWHRAEWEMLTPQDDGTYEQTRGNYMMLTPSDPEDPADKNGEGQNPATYGSSSSGPRLKFDMDAYYKVCESVSRWHIGYYYPKNHDHECWNVNIQILDLDQKTKDFAEATGAAYEIWQFIQDLAEAEGFKDLVLKSMRITVIGFVVSWLLAIAQTGDLLKAENREFDRKITIPNPFGPDGTVWVPWTIGYYVPPVPIPFIDPQVPAHMVPSVPSFGGTPGLGFDGSWDDEIIIF